MQQADRNESRLVAALQRALRERGGLRFFIARIVQQGFQRRTIGIAPRIDQDVRSSACHH